MEREWYNIYEVASLLECRPKAVIKLAEKLQWESKTENKIAYFPIPKVQSETKRRIGEKARLQSDGTIKIKATRDIASYQRMHKRGIRKTRQANGLCQVCGRPKEDTSLSACNSCIDKSRIHRKTVKGKMNHLRHEAKRKGVEITITEAELEQITIPETCPLLGIPLVDDGHIHFKPSYDRIDNLKGYIPGNIWVISALANLMKRDASIEQLRTFAKNILIHFPD